MLVVVRYNSPHSVLTIPAGKEFPIVLSHIKGMMLCLAEVYDRQLEYNAILRCKCSGRKK